MVAVPVPAVEPFVPALAARVAGASLREPGQLADVAFHEPGRLIVGAVLRESGWVADAEFREAVAPVSAFVYRVLEIRSAHDASPGPCPNASIRAGFVASLMWFGCDCREDLRLFACDCREDLRLVDHRVRGNG